MNYFKSQIQIKNGVKVYGNLPKNFVVGYENSDTEEAYFSLLPEVELPEDSDAESITEHEFNSALATIKQLELSKRQEEFLNTVTKVEEKKKENETLKSDVKHLKETFLTADQRFDLLDIEAINIDELKKYKMAQLKEACTEAIYQGFKSESTGYSFGFNELDQTNFTQQLLLVVAAGSNYTKAIDWKTKDNGVVELDTEKFISLVQEAENHKRTQQVKYWDLESQVIDAETNEEVISINW